jgi:NAD(P)H dehydrogenase (quinone)
MNSLIVMAHPEPQSFNGALVAAAREALVSRGHQVRITDLNARGFDPVEHARHFLERRKPARFDAQTEQRFSAEIDALPDDVDREIRDLLWADFLVLQFPLWWFGMPAILKGWMDRVFVYGKLYSSRQRFHAGVCRGKRAMLSVTAGASAEACAHDGQEGDTRLLLWPIHYSLHYLGFTVLEPTLVMGVRSDYDGARAAIQDRHLKAQLEAHRARLSDLDAIAEIPFNAADDWDDSRKLKPGAAVHSPFIRHRPELRFD